MSYETDLVARLRHHLQWSVPYSLKPLRDAAKEAADLIEYMTKAEPVAWALQHKNEPFPPHPQCKTRSECRKEGMCLDQWLCGSPHPVEPAAPDATVEGIMALADELMSECHQTGEAESGSFYADITGPEREKKLHATLHAAIERVIAENKLLHKRHHDDLLELDRLRVDIERAEKEADSYKKTAARLMNDNLDLRRALKEIRDAKHKNAVTLRGMADLVLTLAMVNDDGNAFDATLKEKT